MTIYPAEPPSSVTPAQAAYLKARAIAVPSTRGEASALIGACKKAAAIRAASHPSARVVALFEEGYLQTSRKFCHVARLPEGKTGIEALIAAELASEHPHPRAVSWANGMGELHAANHYRKCHAQREGLWMELDSDTFEALRAYTIARGVDFLWGRVKP